MTASTHVDAVSEIDLQGFGNTYTRQRDMDSTVSISAATAYVVNGG